MLFMHLSQLASLDLLFIHSLTAHLHGGPETAHLECCECKSSACKHKTPD